MSEVTTIPIGEMHGHLCVRIQVPQHPEPDYLVKEFTGARAPGVHILWMESHFWDSPEVHATLANFVSDVRTSSVTVWVRRSATEEHWPSDHLWTVMDCSGLTAAKLTSDTAPEAFAKLPYLPKPTELLVVDPHEGNLTPSVLDEITMNLDPERYAWVYLTAPSDRLMRRAVRSASRAPGWGVRHV